jgi:predicted transcriptional regulator of viral defense system
MLTSYYRQVSATAIFISRVFLKELKTSLPLLTQKEQRNNYEEASKLLDPIQPRKDSELFKGLSDNISIPIQDSKLT